MKLLINLVRKDFKRNPAITTALVVFLILAALLMAGGLRVAGTMISAYDQLNQKAIPPEYLQMHKGEYDNEAVGHFAANQDGIQDFLTVEMLTINNASIIYQGETLEKVLMDNSFVVQNVGFDYLLNMDNQVATVKPGEVGVPVYYAEILGIAPGDLITLKKDDYIKDLKVATIIRDAQMNVAMTSSKRFLISPVDQLELSQKMGEWEYSFQFLLKEGVDTGVLEQAYQSANLPANGVAITGSLLNLYNVFSYGLVAMIIVAISLLLIFMAMLCLSYIIRATMAEEQKSVGEMKAIGFPGKSIEILFQMKYLTLMAVAGIIGYLGAIPFGNFFSEAVVRYCGTGSSPGLIWGLPFLGMFFFKRDGGIWMPSGYQKELKQHGDGIAPGIWGKASGRPLHPAVIRLQISQSDHRDRGTGLQMARIWGDLGGFCYLGVFDTTAHEYEKYHPGSVIYHLYGCR